MKKLFPIALMLNLIFLPYSAKSDQKSTLQLTKKIKNELILAKPILGRKVVKTTFNSTPLLIMFFASW